MTRPHIKLAVLLAAAAVAALILPAFGGDVRVVEIRRSTPVRIPPDVQMFPIFTPAGEVAIHREAQPSKDKNTSCSTDPGEDRHPVYPGLYYLPCPERWLVAAEGDGPVRWRFPLHHSIPRMSPAGDALAIDDDHGERVVVLNREDGRLLHQLPHARTGCGKRSVWMVGFDAAQSLLYVSCTDFVDGQPNILNRIDLETGQVETLYTAGRRIITGSGNNLESIQVMDGGRFLVMAEEMSSKLSPWGGVTVYDTREKRVVFREKIYPHAWAVDIAVGKGGHFAVGYLCDYDKGYHYCLTHYAIQAKE